jgi:hypothetical protein
MRFLINAFIKYRDPFALAMYLAGVPIVYFLRDGLALAPSSSIFSMALIFSPLFLSLVFKNYSLYYKPNAVTFKMLFLLLLFMLCYMYLKDRYYLTYNINNEILYYVLIGLLGINVIFMPTSSIGNSFIYIIIVLSYLSCLSLIYYVSKNPLYVIGQRASFGIGEDFGGNPHINSKGAYLAIVVGVLALKYYKTVKLGLIIPTVLIILSIIVLFLTQTMLAFLATFLFGCFFLFFNLSFPNVISTFRLFFTKWYILLIMAVGFGVLTYQYNKNQKLLEPAVHYFEVRINNLTKSFFDGEGETKSVKKTTGDDSANTRIMHFSRVFERLEEAIDDGNYHYVLFGQGYKYMYIDIPHLEMLDSFGLVGFAFYSLLFIRVILMCTREMRNPDSIGNEFLAYIFLYFVVANFTAGQMLDYYRFGTMFIMCRFLKK